MGSEISVSTKEETLTLLLRKGECSAASLACDLGISVQAVRRHLRGLQNNGLVIAKQISLGPGRPFNLWQLTSKGHNQFKDESSAFALDLLSSIQDNLPAHLMIELLTKQASDKAKIYRNKIGKGSLEKRLKELVKLRNQEGYLAESHLSEDGMSWFLQEYSCSIREIAEEFPIVCEQELDLIRKTFPECQVQRVQWRLEFGHACGFHICPL